LLSNFAGWRGVLPVSRSLELYQVSAFNFRFCTLLRLRQP
jgi:hypothetical protein